MAYLLLLEIVRVEEGCYRSLGSPMESMAQCLSLSLLLLCVAFVLEALLPLVLEQSVLDDCFATYPLSVVVGA